MTFDPKTSRENELRRDLATVREAIREVVTGGSSVSIAGGVSQTRASLSDLRDQESILVRQLNSIRGIRSRTLPDFSG